MKPNVYLRGAIYKRDKLVFVGDNLDEDKTWMIFTGWGDKEEIDEKKQQGYRFTKVEVKERTDGEE